MISPSATPSQHTHTQHSHTEKLSSSFLHYHKTATNHSKTRRQRQLLTSNQAHSRCCQLPRDSRPNNKYTDKNQNQNQNQPHARSPHTNTLHFLRNTANVRFQPGEIQQLMCLNYLRLSLVLRPVLGKYTTHQPLNHSTDFRFSKWNWKYYIHHKK